MGDRSRERTDRQPPRGRVSRRGSHESVGGRKRGGRPRVLLDCATSRGHTPPLGGLQIVDVQSSLGPQRSRRPLAVPRCGRHRATVHNCRREVSRPGRGTFGVVPRARGYGSPAAARWRTTVSGRVRRGRCRQGFTRPALLLVPLAVVHCGGSSSDETSSAPATTTETESSPADSSTGVSEFELEVDLACNYSCVVEMECVGRDFSQCLSDCYDLIEWQTPPRPPCDGARLQLAECQATLDCAQYGALQAGQDNPCTAEVDGVEAACG